jgi:hypothetical protein
MTTLISPVLFKQPPHPAAEAPEGLPVHKEDTREYLADMLREMSAIARWAGLNRAQAYIEAALHEIDSEEEGQ